MVKGTSCLTIFIGAQETIKVRKLKSWKCLEHGLGDALEDIGNNHQVSWQSVGQSVNWSVSQAISPTHAVTVAHSRIGSLAHWFTRKLTLYREYRPRIHTRSLTRLSVSLYTNQSISWAVSNQSVNQPANQCYTSSRTLASLLTCSPAHCVSNSQALSKSVNQSIISCTSCTSCTVLSLQVGRFY